jgi:hypothetical protein
MKSSDYRNDELFLRNRLFMTGSFDMPFVYAQDVSLTNMELIAFSNTKHNELSDLQKSKTVHFFLDDYKFDEVWNGPAEQLSKLSQYAQLLSPGFSVYSNMPEPIQIYNTFRNRWCAAYWQFNKQVVIPTIVWGGENTYEFCFDGIEKGCIVAVSTIGASDDEDEFKSGYEEMCKKIQPDLVINYGNTFDWMTQYSRLLGIPYVHSSNSGAKE